jgi:hypothetical protein
MAAVMIIITPPEMTSRQCCMKRKQSLNYDHFSSALTGDSKRRRTCPAVQEILHADYFPTVEFFQGGIFPQEESFPCEGIFPTTDFYHYGNPPPLRHDERG